MSAKYANVLSEEEREAAVKKGMKTGIEVYKSLKKGMSVEEVAKRYDVSIEEVEKFKALL